MGVKSESSNTEDGKDERNDMWLSRLEEIMWRETSVMNGESRVYIVVEKRGSELGHLRYES